MFRGGSCYPISPYEDKSGSKKDNDETLIDTNDQILKILKHYKLTSRDLSFISSEDHMNYIKMMMDQAQSKPETLRA